MVDPVQLQTNRLLLRQFRSSDVGDVLAYRDDAEFSRYLPHIPQPFTRRDAEEFVARNIAVPWDKYPTFAVVLKDAVIGTVNFDVDQAQCIAMLGFAIGRAYWNKGIGCEAVRTAIVWGFEAFDLAKIWATTDARNARSQRLMEKLGMQLEGRLRSHERARDGRTDKLCYGLLRVEWQDVPTPQSRGVECNVRRP
jgi:[ribosomal protein S5]-alanine N-acetyltransferase